MLSLYFFLRYFYFYFFGTEQRRCAFVEINTLLSLPLPPGLLFFYELFFFFSLIAGVCGRCYVKYSTFDFQNLSLNFLFTQSFNRKLPVVSSAAKIHFKSTCSPSGQSFRRFLLGKFTLLAKFRPGFKGILY